MVLSPVGIFIFIQSGDDADEEKKTENENGDEKALSCLMFPGSRPCNPYFGGEGVQTQSRPTPFSIKKMMKMCESCTGSSKMY